jgi:hypothetical protein
MELGRIERLDPRHHWKNEAQDFTPWLRENIDVLGEALGLEIDSAVDSEVPVGSFSADILGTDLGSGTLLLVENQLEPTDHSHLGQLLTYASGLNARVVVWIARQFRDEHRHALTWLNENTPEDLKFFGVELELIRIGDSPFAPNLKVMVTPSEWQKSAAAVKGGQVTDRQQKYREFWGDLISDVRARDPSFTGSTPENAPKQNWCAFSAGRAGFADNAVFGWEGREAGYVLRVELYIDTGDKERNKRAFDLLETQKAAIEAEFGEPLTWTRRDDIQASRIFASKPGGIDDPDELLRQHRAWLVDRLFRIREVFGPRIKALDLG